MISGNTLSEGRASNKTSVAGGHINEPKLASCHLGLDLIGPYLLGLYREYCGITRDSMRQLSDLTVCYSF